MKEKRVFKKWVQDVMYALMAIFGCLLFVDSADGASLGFLLTYYVVVVSINVGLWNLQAKYGRNEKDEF